MSLKFANLVAFSAVAAAAGLSLWAHNQLPDTPIATHFNAAGQVNGTMPRDVALAFGPIMALVIAAIMLWVVPVLMPKKASLARSSQAYSASVIVTVVFLCLVHAGLVARALHMAIDIPRWSLAGVGGVFIVLGNYLPKTRYNYAMGIRNPWTLCNEEVWDKTHQLAGPLFMLLGALVIADAALVPLPLAFILMVPAALIVTLICGVYSYFVARKVNAV
jgi:uncharacterized membrane protein